MNRSVNLLARLLGLAWVGVLAFALYPAGRPAATLLQAVAYGAAWLGMLGWALFEYSARAARYRRRWFPVLLGAIAAIMGAAAASGYDGGMAMVIFALIAAMVAGAEDGLAPALGVTAAGILGVEVSGLAFGAEYGTLLGFPAVIASGLLIGRNWGAFRIQAEQSLALLAQRERLEAEQRRADLLDERTRIAREIHDVLAHSLGALGIQIQAARSVLTDYGDIDKAVDLLTAAQRMAAEGLTETRRAVHALRTGTLPLGDELAQAVSDYAQRYHVAASLDSGGPARPVPPEATVALLRVAQEALVNAAKHGAGRPVTVRLDYEAAGVRLSIRNEVGSGATGDRGPGDPESAGGPGSARGPGSAGGTETTRANRVTVHTADAGYGLTGMRERLRILDGTLAAGYDDGCWVVTAHLPLPRPTGKMTA